MIDTLFHLRIETSRDWATAVFIFAFSLIAITKSFFEIRFNDFIRLLISDKYIKIYKEGNHLVSGFNSIMFVVQIISFSFFIQLIGCHYGYFEKTNGIVFVQITTFLTFFILSKFIIERIIAIAFDIEEFSEQFNLQKVSYRSYLGLFVLLVDFILFYNNNFTITLINIIIVIILTINSATYVISLKKYQNLLFGKLFYFILYLCALEIAPYYFIYYWFTKR